MKEANSFDPIPARAGIGLKAQHIPHVLEARPDVGWFEIHAENYMGAGGPPHRALEAVRALYPLSVHGVGLSLGGAHPLNHAHLQRLAGVVARYGPGLISEHLAWAAHGNAFFNDLLPLPYTEETLDRFCTNIERVQAYLGRTILVENPSSYLRPGGSTMKELDFLSSACARTGCGLLLDVNNVFVSACNHGFDAGAWLNAVPAELVGEIHLAGHAVDRRGDVVLRIDDHGSRVKADVWKLFERTVGRIGPRPTLIEWDTDVPDFSMLQEEALRAERILDAHRTGATSSAEATRHAPA